MVVNILSQYGPWPVLVVQFVRRFSGIVFWRWGVGHLIFILGGHFRYLILFIHNIYIFFIQSTSVVRKS
jgi:hypothetical protein